jgi:hypothetical protein
MIGLFNDVPVTRRYRFTVTILAGCFCITFFGFCVLASINGLARLERTTAHRTRWLEVDASIESNNPVGLNFRGDH